METKVFTDRVFLLADQKQLISLSLRSYWCQFPPYEIPARSNILDSVLCVLVKWRKETLACWRRNVVSNILWCFEKQLLFNTVFILLIWCD